jgi:hypothetical protein
MTLTAEDAMLLILDVEAQFFAASRSDHAANALKFGPLRRHPDIRSACSGKPAVTALPNRGHEARALLGRHSTYVRYIELSSTRFKDFWRK